VLSTWLLNTIYNGNYHKYFSCWLQTNKTLPPVEIFCTSLLPSVVISPEGIVDLNRNIIYYSQNDNHKKDFVFVTGNSQPVSLESEYILAEEILKIVKKFGSHEIVTLGANITGSFSREPKVYCTATHNEVLESLTIKDVVKLVERNRYWNEWPYFRNCKVV
jgi:proteasome assembly chaperone (PAC2) family protein